MRMSLFVPSREVYISKLWKKRPDAGFSPFFSNMPAMYSAAMFSSRVPLPRPLNFSEAIYVTLSRSSSMRMESTPVMGPCAAVVKRSPAAMKERRNAETFDQGLWDG